MFMYINNSILKRFQNSDILSIADQFLSGRASSGLLSSSQCNARGQKLIAENKTMPMATSKTINPKSNMFLCKIQI